MSPLSNADVNNVLRQADLEVITVHRNSEIQQSTLERCMMRMRIISSFMGDGLVTDSDLVSNFMDFFVIMNQHIGTRYPTSNMPPWAVRLKQELIGIIEAKVDSLNSELSAKLNDLKKELADLGSDVAEVRKSVREIKKEIVASRMEIEKKIMASRMGIEEKIMASRMELRLIVFVVSIVAVLLYWGSLVSPALA